jgi:hypothetical protein
MTCRLLTGLFLFFLALISLAKSPTNPTFKTASASAFIENKGQIIDQNNKSNSSVLYLQNTPGFNVQLRRRGFFFDLDRTPNPEKSGQVIDLRFLKSEFDLTHQFTTSPVCQ